MIYPNGMTRFEHKNSSKKSKPTKERLEFRAQLKNIFVAGELLLFVLRSLVYADSGGYNCLELKTFIADEFFLGP